MGFTIESVLDVGDDRLAVSARDADGNEVIAFGWVSATTNYFPPSAYSTDPATDDLARDQTVKARAMTAAEVGAYAQQLLADQFPDEAPAVVQAAPSPIAFSVK